MTRELPVEVLQDPSHRFTGVPSQRRPAPDAPTELHVVLQRSGPGLSILAHADRVSPRGAAAWHRVRLEVSAGELLDRADRLRSIWRDQVVRHQGTGSGPGQRVGGYPLAEAVDLSEQRALTEPLVTKLADEGFDLLHVLLDGKGYDLGRFREFLLGVLSGDQQLRISFDSEWQLPWPMLAVDPAECPSPWEAFLGHRHQIEQSDPGYGWDHAPLGHRERACTSLNKDTELDGVGRASEVHELLDERSELTVRRLGKDLLNALSCPVVYEDVMYFWCHGRFVDTGASSQFLAVRLSDSEDIDGPVLERRRRCYLHSPQARFKPFVLLNACHAAAAAAPGHLKNLGQELIDQGAAGVLAPQIEIPQLFATHYAYAFLDRYLTGRHTAGEISRFLVRRFAREYGNPLALAYSLSRGIDSRLDLAP